MRVLWAIAFLFCAGTASVAAPLPATIAVLAVGAEALSPGLAARQAGLVHLVQSDLQARSAARVLSRGQAALFLDELGLAAAGLTEPETAQRYGRAVAADYLVLVRVAAEGPNVSARVSVERVGDGAEVWRGEFAAPAEQPAALADEVAAALVQALRLPSAPPRAPEAGAAPTLAVLDFRSEGEAGALDAYLADLADLLSANLTALELPLVERGRLNAVLQELGVSASGLARPASLSKVGTLLGAQRVLETSIVVTGGKVLFDSQLIAPETGVVTGSGQAAGPVGTVPALIEQLAVRIAGALHAPVSASRREDLARQNTGSLEAALHAAAGWRLSRDRRPEEAVAELQQAIYLDPGLASAWEELARQYEALRDYPKWADCARRFFPAAAEKTDRRLAAAMAESLANAEMWQGHYAEEEAAARLALHYLPDDQDLYQDLIMALARQGKAAEVQEFCDDVYRRFGADSWKTFNAFAFGLQWLGFGEVPADTTERVIAVEFDLIARALDVFDGGTPGPEYYLARPMTDALVLASGSRPPQGPVPGLRAPVRHAEECLRLARRMTTYTDRAWTCGGGWLVTGLVQYKLGHGPEAEAALSRCLPLHSAAASLDILRYTSAWYGMIYWLLGHTYQDLLSDPERAIASYRQAGFFLLPMTQEAQDVRAQLAALHAPAARPTEWRRTLGVAGPPLAKVGRGQLLAWLRAHGYDLQHTDDPRDAQCQEAGLQVLMWEGRRSDAATADDLRAYVAGGGSLLVLLSDQRFHATAGSLLGGSAESLDVTLDWLLPAFGMHLSHHVTTPSAPSPFLPGDVPLPLPSADRAPLGPALSPSAAEERAWESKEIPQGGERPSAGRPLHLSSVTSRLSAATYVDPYFPIDAPRGTSALRLQGPDRAPPDTVVALCHVGLGKFAIVSLSKWFPSGDRGDSRLPVWQSDLLHGVMDWLSTPAAEAHFEAADRWAESRAALAARDFPTAIAALDRLPADPDAVYWAARIADDRLGLGLEAASRYRQVLASQQADAWLKRKASLDLGVLAMRSANEAAAREYLTAAAGAEPDLVWGQARVVIGDLKLGQGDSLGAAQEFRRVADELGHSEERCRALFGLAYTLARQGKPEAAERVYDALAMEFGKAPLPADMDTRWPDPWRAYYPPERRGPQPTVLGAVAAGKALLHEDLPKADPATAR
jgi:tetratricopeptide (TPR) repeat protein